MSETPQDLPNAAQSNAAVNVEDLLRSLRRKEGTWVQWGQACQTLQKAGYGPQQIFEETGFEPIQQNQVIVGSQVYTSLLNADVSEKVRSHFEQRGSDILYELRILTQTERAAAATLVLEKNLNMDDARDIAKAIKDFSRLHKLPEGFSKQAGDAVAYQYWKAARQKSDFQERARLIAKGLMFVETPEARQQIEKLLTDSTVVSVRPAPLLPLYRLESEDELPRLIPVVGKMPLKREDLQAVPFVEEIEPFRVVKFSGTGAWVPVPGWQVIFNAEDPVALLCNSDILLQVTSDQRLEAIQRPEELLIVVDRAKRQWAADGYFITEQDDSIQIQWFETEPEVSLLGQVILVMRPKKILDENVTKDLWQIDE